MIKNIVLICPKITNSDGIGRHAISLIEGLSNKNINLKIITTKQDSFFYKVQEFCIKYYMRNIYDLFFCIFADFLLITKYRNFHSVSPSVITGLLTSQVHFSSCHIHCLKELNTLWKLLDPRNLSYVIQEYIQYKFCNKAIFISNLQKKQFQKYYGKRVGQSNVLHPVLSKKNFNKNFNDCTYGENYTKHQNKRILFLGYHFRLKGLGISIKTVNLLEDFKLDIIGEDSKFDIDKYEINNNILFMGKKDFMSIDWSKYSFFIFPSKTDAYAFVVQEALRNGLIPIISSETGASEILLEYNLNNIVKHLSNNNEDEIAEIYSKKILNIMNNFGEHPKDIKAQKIFNHDSYIKEVIQLLE